MRRLLMTLSMAAAFAALAQPAEAQLKFGAHGAMISSLDEASALNGEFGAGARVMLDPPLFPLAVVASGTYYFPDCVADCSYWTATLAGQLRLPTPLVSPYLTAGWQTRRTDNNGTKSTANGPVVGLGVQVNFMLSLFLESAVEFNKEIEGLPDLDNTPIVFKGGILIG
jgi:hypothetical protein